MVVNSNTNNLFSFNSQLISFAEVQSEKPYIDLVIRMLTNKPNKNRQGVTAEFIDDVVERKEHFVGLPLVVDADKVRRGEYRHGLGHKLSGDGKFYTEQIGSFYNFTKSIEGDTVSLVGQARVYKRDEKITSGLTDLFNSGDLKFSFEIFAGEILDKENVQWVVKSSANELVGMAWVSTPAYDEATALAFVAEADEVKKIEKMVEEASVFVSSDVNIETIAYWIYRAVDQLLGGQPLGIERICPDTIILYDRLSGRTYRAEYRIGEESIDIMDFYEVEYIRKERGEAELNEEMNKVAEIVEQTADAPVAEPEEVVKAEAEPEATPEAEAEPVVSEEKAEETVVVDAEVVQDNKELEALTAELESVKAQVEELKAYKVKYEELIAEKQEQEMNEKRETIKVFASKFGLRETDAGVAEAIANLDYEAIVKIAANVKPVVKDNPNPFISEIKPSKKYTLLDAE